ncbi:hypothetical protein CLAIMM_11070 [Cladophialophora immunda]|nr:hypothetical protein CLAIMM_11070 [Cladophialophora immunda]
MTGRYIPPALRARGGQELDKAQDSEQGSGSTPSGPRGGNSRPLATRSDALPDGDLCSLKEIERHFWPDPGQETSEAKQKTLHDSAATPGELSYVLLFKDANPRWQDDGIIFTKSSLELLPAELADTAKQQGATDGTAAEHRNTGSTSNGSGHMKNGGDEAVGQEHGGVKQDDKLASAPPTQADDSQHLREGQRQRPVAVFSQLRRSSTDSSRHFNFAGYYRIVHLSFLPPHSAELVRMLEQKWSSKNPRTGQVRQRQRDASAWQESLKMRWAVVKFERDEEAMQSLGPVKVERLEDDDDEGVRGGGEKSGRRMSGRERKGVNELLRELRMG